MTTASISKAFTFSASHQLLGLPGDHPCSRLHGHNYEVYLDITGDTDEIGFVIDYRALDPFKAWLDETLDHRHLNDLMDENPTAEHLADWFLDVAHNLLWETAPDAMRRVTELGCSVSETPKTLATASRKVDPFEAEEQLAAEEPDVHDLDADRYRWNFRTDGSGKKPINETEAMDALWLEAKENTTTDDEAVGYFNAACQAAMPEQWRARAGRDAAWEALKQRLAEANEAEKRSLKKKKKRGEKK